MARALATLALVPVVGACAGGVHDPAPAPEEPLAEVATRPTVEPDPALASGRCSYPAGSSLDMALGEVLFPYRWAQALDAAGERHALDLSNAPCDDPDVDWSPFDVLVFISIPAW